MTDSPSARRIMPSRKINRIDHWSLGGGSHAPFPSGGSSGMAHQDTGFDPRDFVDSLMAYHPPLAIESPRNFSWGKITIFTSVNSYEKYLWGPHNTLGGPHCERRLTTTTCLVRRTG